MYYKNPMLKIRFKNKEEKWYTIKITNINIINARVNNLHKRVTLY